MTTGGPPWLQELKLAEKHAVAGRLAESEAVLRQILKVDPNQAEALNALAAIAANVGKLDVAIALQERAVVARPTAPMYRSNLGEMYRRAGRYASAIEQGERAVTLKPDYAAGHNNLGVTYASSGDAAAALRCYDAALAVAPEFVEAHVNRGKVLTALGRKEWAEGAFRSALELAPDRADVANELGLILSESGRQHDAVAFLERAAVGSGRSEMWNNLGAALKEVGWFGDALAAFDRASTLDPKSAAPLLGVSQVKTFRDPADKHIAQMEALARDSAVAFEDRIYLHFALGKAYDDVGRTDEAFAQLRAGNELKRRSAGYNEAAALGLFERVKDVFDAELIAASSIGGEDRTPIFVVGMPRSGTTLVEQIISSHRDVGAAGEISAMNDVTRGLGSFPESLRGVSEERITLARDAYLNSLRSYGPEKARITDKTPSNIYMIGVIQMMMSDAVIVHVQRDPLDTCLSCYSQLFTREMGHTYGLAELGRYYRAYHDLMRHWDEVLPAGRVFNVQYEDVVADTEGQARQLLDHCGLEWDAQVLAFHQSARAVSTASAQQVRQPIYGTSVARWRRYEAHLGPLIEALGDLVES